MRSAWSDEAVVVYLFPREENGPVDGCYCGAVGWPLRQHSCCFDLFLKARTFYPYDVPAQCMWPCMHNPRLPPPDYGCSLVCKKPCDPLIAPPSHSTHEK